MRAPKSHRHAPKFRKAAYVNAKDDIALFQVCRCGYRRRELSRWGPWRKPSTQPLRRLRRSRGGSA